MQRNEERSSYIEATTGTILEGWLIHETIMMIIYIVFLQRFASFCIHAIVIVQAMSIDCFAVSIDCETILYSLQDHDAFKEEFSTASSLPMGMSWK